ncbi:calcineurin-binding protein 1 isoform X2 [Cryptomeria japonica]|uniref:calcineurin-binding protein 1 isoform X2 n=1 Tax=Cryptomeria japonica TaxID=3369 RepID=UPI0027DAA60A|nr:calcineurin-binding protein 1 isoform X2 [Cryptomeria japonica]
MFSIAAINDSDSKSEWEPLAPTKEAREFRLKQMYQEGLKQLHAGDYLTAQNLFEAIIQDPLISITELEHNISDSHIIQLRFLTLKNLGNTFAKQGSMYYEKAVQCYLQAVEIDRKDIVVWNHLGTLSCALGSLNTSRRAFEEGLNCSPNNWNCMEKLLEVLIAIRDEVSCLIVAKTLLKKWHSHSRASIVKRVIEESQSTPFEICGIDKLEPKHIGLSFPKKRKMVDIEENNSCSKIGKIQQVDLHLLEASWGALIDALLNILKSKMPSNHEHDIEYGEAGCYSDYQRLVNAKYKFLVRNIEISDVNLRWQTLNMPHFFSGDDTDKSMEVNASLECSSKACRILCKDKGISTSTLAIHRDVPVIENINERTRLSKERELSTDEEPPQERRSTRLEQLRTRKSEREESDLEKGKEQAKLLRKMLNPFIVCDTRQINFSKIADISSMKHPSEVDRNMNLFDSDDSDVIKFLKEINGNYGVYQIGELILEKLSANNLPYEDGLYRLLELDKMTRQWNHDKSPYCSLFLAELNSDLATSCSKESKFSDLFNEAMYHLCKVVESISVNMHFNSFVMSAGHIPKTLSQSTISFEIGSQYKHSLGNKNMDRSCSSFMEGSTVSDGLTRTDNAVVHTNKDGLKSRTNDSVLTLDWSFWVRFHWLSGRLWTLSGDREKGCKEFQKCFSILNDRLVKNGTGDRVMLPYCKVDKEISLQRVQHELRLLEIEGLLKSSCPELLEREKYSELVKLLSPVILSGNEKCFVQGLGVNKDYTVDTSVELSGLDTLILACEKDNPKDLATLLKCHKRRLEILCLAAGIAEIPEADNVIDKVSMCNACNLTFEVELEEARKGHWNKMVADEIKSISRCASHIKEEIDESETPASFDIPTALLGRLQCLLLTVMCHIIKVLPSLKSSGLVGTDSSEQLETTCFVNAAVAFCKLQHLDSGVSLRKQVELLATVHELLAEHGLCCAGKDCEGGEGTFLKLAIKHLLAVEIKLKMNLNSANCQENVNASLKQYSENVHLTEELPKSSFGNTNLDGRDDLLKEEEIDRFEPRSLKEIAVASTSGTEVVRNTEDVLNSIKSSSDICKGSSFETKRENMQIGDAGDSYGDFENTKVDLGIDNVLDQSFFCLYDLNLKGGLDTSSEDDLAIHRNTSLGDYQTKEQCADVFKYLLPYAKASSRNGLVKLRKVLRAIRKQFPQPPEEVLNGNTLDIFLEDPDFNEEKIRDMAMSGENIEHIVRYAFASGEDCNNDQTPLTGRTVIARELEMCIRSMICGKNIDASTEPYLEVYTNLYYILAQVEEMSATDKFSSFVLTKEGEEFVQQNASLFKFDLLYNPLRFESWQKLANIYDEEVDLMLNDGSKHINVVEWKKQSNLSQRVEISRRRSRRCSLISLALAKTPEQQCQAHELLALVYYDSIQNVVPLYDQRHYVPARDSAWTNFCQNSLKHFEKAFAYKPEWSHPFYLGKLSEKLGHPYEKALSYYSKAASMNRSAVDPVYRIHASRLKLLYTIGRHNLRAIEVVAGYCYQPATKEKVTSILEGACKDDLQNAMLTEALKGDCPVEAPGPLEEAWSLLFDDCISALEICVEGDLKHFHKARYMLAQGLYYRGEENDLERAKEELSFCFKSSRSVFTINMWEIDGAIKKARRKAPGHGGAKKGLELAMPESSRKFITCIRKYILLYLILCERTGDFYTLERAYSSIRTDKKFSLCLEDIIPVALGRYIQALGTAISRAESHGSSNNSTFEQLLEKMFNLFMDQGNLWSDLAGLSESRSTTTPEFSEITVYSFIHRYLHVLEIDGRVDALEGVNEKIRKRFKNPKLSNVHCARVCKHASLAWCRSILTNLASITPLPLEIHTIQSVTQAVGNMDHGLQLVVDLQTDELLNISSEDSNLQSKLKGKLHPLLSRIRNVPIKQATSENMDIAVKILHYAFNFYRESSCGALPSGIHMCVVPSRFHLQGTFPSTGNNEHASSVEVLDLSMPRKLLLWAYTLVHGRYCNIQAVVKNCEENAKVINMMHTNAS